MYWNSENVLVQAATVTNTKCDVVNLNPLGF